jgi:hypothetical protein
MTPLQVTVVDPALDPAATMWGDATAAWQPAGVAWMGLLTAAGVPARGVPALGDEPAGLVIDEAFGPPPVDPAEALALVRDALGALVRPDLRGVLVLRMDDPGGAVRRHLDGWRHHDVPAATWQALWDTLRGFGRASVFCCPGWVDDDGSVRESRTVNPDEWAALDEGVAAGLVDLECHGFTHIHPDTGAWVAADDRFSAAEWYRELWPPREAVEPAVDAQAAILDAWQDACGAATTLVAPGEAWGTNTVAAARRCGMELFTSWGVCRLQLDTPVWSVGIGSPYLDEADPSWLSAGLPAVGYWHDRDMAVHGPAWVAEQLDAWRDCGATRGWAFADLAAAYRMPIDAVLDGGEVVVHQAPDVPLLIERA